MVLGLLTEGSVENRQFEAAWYALTSATNKVLLRPSVISASLRLRFGPNA